MNSEEQQLPLFDTDPDSQFPSAEELPTAVSVGSEFSKYIVYVDESGDHGLKSIDEHYPVFVLAFCIFHKRHYSEAIVPALEKFKFNWFGHDQIILHENEIRKESGAFNIFKSKEENLEFLDQLTGIIERSNFVLVSCTIDKRALRNRGESGSNPYHIALASCMESLHGFLEEKSQGERKTHVVFECRGKKEDQKLELEFRRICDGNNSLGINLPFEIQFSDKKAMSSGLQLADLVARPIGLSTLKPDQHNRAFEVLKCKFYCEGGRESVGEGYEGVGMKIYPAPESEKSR